MKTARNLLTGCCLLAAVASATAMEPLVGVFGDTVITEVPEGGTVTRWKREGSDYYRFWQYVLNGDYSDKIGEMVTYADGTVYIKNIIGMYDAYPAYLRGSFTADDEITVPLPQPGAMYVYDNDIAETDYITVCKYFTTGDNTFDFAIAPEVTEVKYKLNDESCWELQGMDEEGYILGAVYGNDEPKYMGIWAGYGTWRSVFSPFDDNLQHAPEGLETVYCLLDDYHHTRQFVEIGFDSNDCWARGFSTYLPESWVKGTLDANSRVTFDSKQYIGDAKNYSLYFMGSNYEFFYDVDFGNLVDYKLRDSMAFDYDKATGTMKSNQAYIINGGTESVINIERHLSPSIAPATDEQLTPAAPVITATMPFDSSRGYGGIQWDMPSVTVDDIRHMPGYLYYRIYVDDELYEFTPAVYHTIKEPMTEVPFGFNDEYDFVAEVMSDDTGMRVHRLYHYFKADEVKIGIQTVYRNGDTVSESAIAETVLVRNAGMTDTMALRDVTSVAYFDMTGCEVSASTRGVLIRRTTYADGTVQTEKILN